MIKCWNKEGKEVDMTQFTKEGDDDMSEVTQQLLPLMAMLSQSAKEIITKVHIEDDNMVMVLEQK